MTRIPRIPFPLILTGAVVGMVLYACGSDGPKFGGGGNSNDETWIPGSDDTAVDTGDTAEDTGIDTDTVDDTGIDDTAVEDTAPPYEGEGYERGDVAHNLVAPDNNGGTFRLYEHGGSPVVLVFGYAQSYTFQEICGYLPGLASDFASDGVATAVLLFSDETGSAMSEEDASNWASLYGLDNVLYDPDLDIRGTWANATEVKTYLIDQDMVIEWTNNESTSEEQLRQKIEDLVY